MCNMVNPALLTQDVILHIVQGLILSRIDYMSIALAN